MTNLVARKTFSSIQDYSTEQQMITIDAIVSNDSVIKLNKPIRAIWKQAGKYHFINYEKLNMFCYGESYNEALADFYECFSENYRYLCNIKDDSLSNNAKRIKNMFLEYADLQG